MRLGWARWHELNFGSKYPCQTRSGLANVHSPSLFSQSINSFKFLNLSIRTLNQPSHLQTATSTPPSLTLPCSVPDLECDFVVVNGESLREKGSWRTIKHWIDRVWVSNGEFTLEKQIFAVYMRTQNSCHSKDNELVTVSFVRFKISLAVTFTLIWQNNFAHANICMWWDQISAVPPMVDSIWSINLPVTNRMTRLDFPTFALPKRTCPQIKLNQIYYMYTIRCRMCMRKMYMLRCCFKRTNL